MQAELGRKDIFGGEACKEEMTTGRKIITCKRSR
jgi:hypothetical protein